MSDMADADFDYALALSLQERFNQETKIQSKEKRIPAELLERKYDPKGIVDEHWELTDPNPNIHDLYVQFDAMFFRRALNDHGVEVKWSNKMTLCAGLCCYEGRGCLCSIRLSLPLLKLRPRKDLVQTLLHEMIHAYLFVVENNKDHNAHGPQFLHHMHRINKAAGTNITVYHSFHDEVNEYRQHWWKCNGPCQRRPPFFGMVKRVMNRAPSPKDHWWAEHQRACGGTYIKIREPEGYKQGKPRKGSAADVVNKGSTAGRNSKNIKDMFNGVSGKKGGTAVGPGTSQADVGSTQSVSVSRVKAFEGRGQRLIDSIDVDAEPGPSASLSARERMLIAAEKRMKESQRKGKRKKGFESGTGQTSNHDIRKYGTISSGHHSLPDQERPSSPKKSRLSTSLSDSDCCILLDPESPPSSGSVGGDASREPSVTVIDLNDPGGNSSTESFSTPWDNSVIEVDAESSDDDGLKTCPVCGRSDIPAVIINTHIAFCLDEEIESTIVDDDHL